MDIRVDVQRYGAGFPLALDWGCTEIFAGECELYKERDLRSIKTFRYVCQTSGEEVSGVLSEFGHVRGAFRLFSLRRSLIEQVEERALSGGGARMIRAPHAAIIWAGRRVLQLRLLERLDVPKGETFSPAGSAVRWAALTDLNLELMGRAAGSLYELTILGTDLREAAHVDLFDDELLGIQGSGAGAISSKPGAHQQLISVRRDETGAKDFLNVLSREFVGQLIQEKTVVRARRRRAGFAPESWLFARSGRVVVGVGAAVDVSAGSLDGEAWQTAALAELSRLQTSVRQHPPTDLD